MEKGKLQIRNLIYVYNKIPLPVKASVWFVFCSVIQKGIAFFTTPIFTRMMTTEEFGIVSVYNSWSSILTVVLTLQLATGVFNKSMIKYENDKDAYTSSMLFLTSLMILVGLLVFIVFKDYLNPIIGMDFKLTIALFIDLLFSQAMTFWTVRNRFEYQYKNIIFFTLVSTVLSTFGSILAICILPNNKVYARVYTMVFTHIIIYSYIYYKIFHAGKKYIWFSAWKYAIKYNIPLIPHYLSQQVLNQADRLMINNMCGNDATAVYTVAYQLAMVLNIITTAIESSFTPWSFTKISHGKGNEVGKIAQIILIITGVVCLFFTLMAPEFIYILGGKSYERAIWVVPPVCMSVYFIMMYSLISTITFYYERTKLIMAASCIIAILNIILNKFFINVFGMVAAGYTTLICYVCYALIHYLLMTKVCRNENIQNPFNIYMIWIPAIIFVILAILSSIVYKHYILRLVLIVFFAILLFTIIYRNKKELYNIIAK